MKKKFEKVILFIAEKLLGYELCKKQEFDEVNNFKNVLVEAMRKNGVRLVKPNSKKFIKKVVFVPDNINVIENLILQDSTLLLEDKKDLLIKNIKVIGEYSKNLSGGY